MASPGYYLNSKNVPTNCSYFDAAAPGTGPMGAVVGKAPSVEFEKWNGSYNYSLKSKSDYNLNPQPEGFLSGGFPKAEQDRTGVYAKETDRGELSATAETQMNVTSIQSKQFQNRLQDPVRPTMKETTLYSYNGTTTPVTKAPEDYSKFIPTYTNINGQQVRVGGATNFGLRTAVEYSHFNGAAPTGINGQSLQNPDSAIGKNTKPVTDSHVDGPGTFRGSLPDGARFQNYRLISQPTSNALKFDFNLEKDNGTLAGYSQLLGKNVNGVENRYTASYQIAPLFTNPLHVIWDPDNKGEIPAFYGVDTPTDFSYTNMKPLPENKYIKGAYNDVWKSDPSRASTNAYVLGMDKGIHNPGLEWSNGVNTLAGIQYTPEDIGKEPVPITSYGGSKAVFDQYLHNISLNYPNNTFTGLGMPSAGYIS